MQYTTGVRVGHEGGLEDLLPIARLSGQIVGNLETILKVTH
jgi:hypothetical protein